MRLTGQLIKGTAIISAETVDNDENIGFNHKLEACLIDVCKKLEIQIPLWLQKNTREFVQFQKTFFTGEQFIEKVMFDRFEIRLEK